MQRSSAPRGVRFYDDDERIMFINIVDATTRFGPEEATDDHRAEHPMAWAIYEGKEADPRVAFPPPVTFSTPPGMTKPEPPKARGSLAPA